MLLFISESPGLAVPDSAYSGGTHRLDGGILGHPRLYQAIGEASAPCRAPTKPSGLASKPKGSNLVEASTAAVPDKALALAVTKWMLYGEEPPLVGVGLVYKPYYISTEPFSAAYMHLHVWHAAGSNVESEDRLNASCLIFVNISEMSDVKSVAVQHPVLLDVAIKEAMTGTGEPMAPLSFRGFRLHTIWIQQSGGDLVCQIGFPHFLGEGTSSMLKYEPEKFPQGLKQGQKMAITSGHHLKTIGTLPWTLSFL